MAVFGVPQVHEDDALRAVRAAAEMREALEELNAELARTWGFTIETRTGINTGEVFVGDRTRGQDPILGDPVNIAARLEQTAEPGQILLGETTYHLVRDAVSATTVGPLAVKGKPEPLVAWQLHEVVPGASGWARNLAADLVGRDRELRRLEEAFARVAAEGSCEIVTVFGPAGAGKSRLGHELTARLGDEATVVEGRCLPYGEGITFWPIASALMDAAGIGERDRPEAVAAQDLRAPRRRRRLRARRRAARAAPRRRPRAAPRSRRPSGGSASCSSTSARSGRSWPCSTTSSGASRRSSTCSSTSPTGSAARRCSCSASRGPSCSTSARSG